MLLGMQAPDKIKLWRARSPDDLVWAQFGDDYIAFHRPSGKTHFLNLASYFLICEFLLEARDRAAIAAEFVPDDDDALAFDDQLLAMLEHLRGLGLVDAV